MPIYFPPSTPTLPPGINLSSALLPNWNRVKAGVIAGTGSARVALLGDSTFGGYGGNGAASVFTNTRSNAVIAVLHRLLVANGIPAVNDGMFGDQGVNVSSVALGTYDLRVTVGGWTAPSNNAFAGGYFVASSAHTFSLVVTNPIDTIELYNTTTPGGGTYDVNVDGGASLGTISCDAAAGTAKTVLTCTRGAHTINVVYASGTASLVGIVATDSTAHRVYLMPGAHSGANAGAFGSTYGIHGYAAMGSLLAADLTIVNIGINDWRTGPTSTATFTTELNSVIATAQRSGAGDVILCAPTPSDLSVTAYETQRRIIEAIYAVARASNLPLIDFNTLFGSWRAMTEPVSYTGSDTLHPNAAGYGRMATAINQVLVAL